MALAIALIVPGAALAHGGGLDANGCHKERRTATRHCHNGGGDEPSPRVRTSRASVSSVNTLAALPEIQADERTKVAQKMLNRLGYDAGPADGRFGNKTRLAIEAFQRDQRLPVTGIVSDRLIDALIETLAGSEI